MEDILRQLQSADNNQRGEAEARFNAAKQNPSECLSSLCSLTTSAQDEVIRATAAVLLRRTATELWNNAPSEVQQGVKSALLSALRIEPRPHLRKKVCDTIAVIASGLVSDGQWPELLPFLFSISKSSVAHEREAALYIFSQLTEYLGPALEPHVRTMHEIFSSGLKDEDLQVQLSALKATCSILTTLESPNCAIFEDLVPLMLHPISEALNQQQEDQAQNGIEVLIEVVESKPRFWRNHLPTVTQAMLTVASTTTLEDSTRQMGLEFLVSAAEKLPSACRKLPNFVESILPVALGMMLELEDDPDWYTRDDEEDDADEYSNFDAGQESLDRLAIAIGGRAVLPVVFSIIPSLLENQSSWTHRHAGVLAISQIGEGCLKQIESRLTDVVNMVLQKFADPHPRVRWGAINCIGQMCTDFGPRIQRENHEQIVPALISVMGDSSYPRVQSHAAAAVINFCDEASSELITPYLDPLLSRLMGLLNSHSKVIQEQAVTAVAAVSDAAGAAFVPYYDSFMALLKKVLAITVGRKELRRLRGKVMECISLVGLSVGKEKFSPDAESVMDTLVRTQGQRLEPDDPQAFYLMQAYARICRCLKEQFIPYLPFVMPGLLDAAGQKPEIEVLDALEDGEDDETGDLETIRIGDKRIGIRTSALEDKATAVSMIACFVDELQGGFIQFVEPTAQLMVPLLKFFYHDECRTSAAQCLPNLVRCVKDQGDQARDQVRQLFTYIIPMLLDAIQGEPDVDVLVTMVDSLSEVIDAAGPGVFDLESGDKQKEMFYIETMNKTNDLILSVCGDRASRIQERKQTAQEDGWDEEELEDAEIEGEKDDELLERVAYLIGSLLRNYASKGYLTIFEKPDPNGQSILQFAGSLLNPENPATERKEALCIFIDVIEHGGMNGAMYVERVLPAMTMYCTDDSPDVRQAAAYGIGICAEKCGGLFLQAGGSSCLGPIEAVLSAPDNRSTENEAATDNAVSALAKIVEYQPNCMSPDALNQAKKTIIAYLPLRGDDSEARDAHGLLVRWLEKNDPQTLSQLPQVMNIFAEIWRNNDCLSEDDYHRSVSWVKNNLQNEAVMSAISSLGESDQRKLQTILTM